MIPVNKRLVNTILSFEKKMRDPKFRNEGRYNNGELSPRMRKVYDSIVKQAFDEALKAAKAEVDK